MSKPSEWLPKTNKLFERWCCSSPTPREILESFNDLETELADKDRQLAEARAEIEQLRARNAILDNAIAEMIEEQASLCVEEQSITELVAAKDALIEQMREIMEAVAGIAGKDWLWGKLALGELLDGKAGPHCEWALKSKADYEAALAAERGE